MPRSHPEGRDWAVERIAATTAPIIYDIGAGEGTYSDLAKGWRTDALWIGVEIWQPYIEQFDLWRKYDIVAQTDARTLTFPETPFVLLAGDVLEHMTKPEAVTLLSAAKRSADAIMVSIPIIDYPQHEHHGNPFEAHLYQWSFDEMAAELPGECFRGEVIGRYWWTR